MKVVIGPYARYFGAYDLAELLKYVGVNEDRRYDIGDWLDKTWFGAMLRRLNDISKRKIKVRIDDYDTWSMDHTLALIILPMLKQLRQTTHVSGMVDDKDVPPDLRSSAAPPKQDDYYADDNLHKRWEWVMDEMIWTFEALTSDDDLLFYHEKTGEFDMKGYKKHQKRIDNGLRLFGKYYRSLWD